MRESVYTAVNLAFSYSANECRRHVQNCFQFAFEEVKHHEGINVSEERQRCHRYKTGLTLLLQCAVLYILSVPDSREVVYQRVDEKRPSLKRPVH